MRHRSLTFLGLVLALAISAGFASAPALAGSASRSAKPNSAAPQGFVGMNLDGPLLGNPAVNLGRQLRKMVSSGVESVRVVFSWAGAQPQPGGPISFTDTDQVVGAAARRGLTVLPVVLYTPGWDAADHPPGTLATPAQSAPYGAYLTALVGRYGPHGTYWSSHPGVSRQPIRMWQVWNEPNLTYFWPTIPFAPGYVNLVRAAHAAIKQADPGGKVVLAGMPNFAWKDLAQIYAVPGARQTFDVVAVHPYTAEPAHVISILQLMRGVMARNGDARKSIVATETGWNSSVGRNPSDSYCCQTTERGQARDARALLRLLGAHRRRLRLLGFYFYTWLTEPYAGAPSFNFAGLFSFTGGRVVRKPAFDAFSRGALALEHCRRKSRLATRCSLPR